MNRPDREIIYEGRIAGIQYGHYAFRPDRLKGRELVVVLQPENEYDPKAVALMCINGTMARKVGFVPRHHTHKIHKALEVPGTRLHALVDTVKWLPSNGVQGTFIPNLVIHALRKPVAPLRPAGTRRIIL